MDGVSIVDRLEKFLSYGDGNGDGYGNGNGYGDGDGDGYGDGYGNGDGYGYGDGYGNGDGNGYGDGNGDGNGDGYGDGNGNGYGDGYGYGNGYGYGYGDGLEMYDGRKVHTVDGLPTLVYKFHLEDDANGWAVGRIIRADMSLEKTYIAKRDYYFAHGATLQEAIDAVNAKLLAEKSMDERLDAFVAAYPLVDTFVSGHELFKWHNILTGSCLQGRKAFVTDRALDLDTEFTILEFIALTKNVFGGSVIKELEERYKA